uniref:ABC1 atypical kinase-like domain-containing protein n=1 Tax=Zea mays TaxID=4577 RepID=A0A804LQ12_MAIZE
MSASNDSFFYDPAIRDYFKVYLKVACAIGLAVSRSNIAPYLVAFIAGEVMLAQKTSADGEYYTIQTLGSKYRKTWLRLVHSTLELAGPVFIKWGQWAATRPDLFPSDLCTELSKLHTKAPAHSFTYAKKTVEKAFGRKLSDIFEENPVASGSVAQVHRTVLRFREAAHLSRFIYNFRRWKDVSFPRPLYPHVHPAILVETYEHGESVSRYVDDLEGHDRIKSALAHIGTHALLKMLLMERVCENTVSVELKQTKSNNFVPFIRSGEWSNIGGRGTERGELKADKDKIMREYRAQLDAERAQKLANGRNHSRLNSKSSSSKKERKDKDAKKRSKKRRKHKSSSESSSSSSSESSSSDDEDRGLRKSRSQSRSKRTRKEKKSRSRSKRRGSESEEEGPIRLSKFFGK